MTQTALCRLLSTRPVSFPCSWEIIDSGRGSQLGTGPQLSDSLKVFLQEMSAFKQQNPGKVRHMDGWTVVYPGLMSLHYIQMTVQVLFLLLLFLLSLSFAC